MNYQPQAPDGRVLDVRLKVLEAEIAALRKELALLNKQLTDLRVCSAKLDEEDLAKVEERVQWLERNQRWGASLLAALDLIVLLTK